MRRNLASQADPVNRQVSNARRVAAHAGVAFSSITRGPGLQVAVSGGVNIAAGGSLTAAEMTIDRTGGGRVLINTTTLNRNGINVGEGGSLTLDPGGTFRAGELTIDRTGGGRVIVNDNVFNRNGLTVTGEGSSIDLGVGAEFHANNLTIDRSGGGRMQIGGSTVNANGVTADTMSTTIRGAIRSIAPEIATARSEAQAAQSDAAAAQATANGRVTQSQLNNVISSIGSIHAWIAQMVNAYNNNAPTAPNPPNG